MSPLEQIINIIYTRIKSYLNINKVASDEYDEALREYIKQASTIRVLDTRIFPTV
jgi:hypothetical protein